MCELFVKNVPMSTMRGKKPTTNVNNIPIHETTSKIGNLCKFSCPKCDSTTFFSNWLGLKWHTKKIQKCVLKFKPSKVLEARYHACFLCQ